MPCWNHSAGENVYPKLEEGHLGRIPWQSADFFVQAEAFCGPEKRTAYFPLLKRFVHSTNIWRPDLVRTNGFASSPGQSHSQSSITRREGEEARLGRRRRRSPRAQGLGSIGTRSQTPSNAQQARKQGREKSEQKSEEKNERERQRERESENERSSEFLRPELGCSNPLMPSLTFLQASCTPSTTGRKSKLTIWPRCS